MPKLSRKVGTTSQTVYVFVQDTTSATGSGLTGLAFNTAGLTAYYGRTREAAVAISLATQTVTGAFSSGGFVQYDATNEPGIYRLDIPNAVLASGVDSAHIYLQGAANMAPLVLEIDLDAQVDVTHWNGTAVKTPTVAGVVESRLTGTCTQGASDMLIRCGSSTSTPAIYATSSGGSAGVFEASGASGYGLQLTGSNTSGFAGLYCLGATAIYAISNTDAAVIFDGSNPANKDGLRILGGGTGKDINLAGSQSIAGYLTGVASPTFVGNGAQVTLGTSSYQARIFLVDDNGGSADRYIVAFFKNGEMVTTGNVTGATLTVTSAAGVALFTAAALTEIGTTGVFKYDSAAARIVSGTGYVAVCTWTDDATSHSWPTPVGRDST